MKDEFLVATWLQWWHVGSSGSGALIGLWTNDLEIECWVHIGNFIEKMLNEGYMQICQYRMGSYVFCSHCSIERQKHGEYNKTILSVLPLYVNKEL